jgi:hypothetical protein
MHVHRANLDVHVQAQRAPACLFKRRAIESKEHRVNGNRERAILWRCQPDRNEGRPHDEGPKDSARQPSPKLHAQIKGQSRAKSVCRLS